MLRRLSTILPSIFYAFSLLAFGLGARTEAANIYIDESGFDPSYLEVTVGETVTWWNVDSWGDPHTTRSYSYPWSSGTIDWLKGFSLTMNKAGTFDYVDERSAEMGTLVVKEATPPPPPTPSALVDPVRLPDGTFQCTVTNLVPWKDFVVEVSTNLVNWTSLSTNLPLSSTETYIDNSTPAGRRFYRVWQALP